MIRLFIALEIPGDIREYIDNERKNISSDLFKWEPVNKLHLTLKFIGNFPKDFLKDLMDELSFIENYLSFRLSLSSFGFFFNRKQPRILWLGLSNDNNLFNLVNDLNKHLVKFNVPVEEKLFKPHLTLLRVPEEAGAHLEKLFRGKSLNKMFISDRVILYKSELAPKGSKHIPLQVYKLK